MTTPYAHIKYYKKRKTALLIEEAQRYFSELDVEGCRMLAQWLSRHIKLLEADLTKFKMSLEDLGLSNRAYNVLKNNGIDTIHQLIKLSINEDDIRVLKGAGRLVSEEILHRVHEFQNTYIFKKVR